MSYMDCLDDSEEQEIPDWLTAGALIHVNDGDWEGSGKVLSVRKRYCVLVEWMAADGKRWVQPSDCLPFMPPRRKESKKTYPVKKRSYVSQFEVLKPVVRHNKSRNCFQADEDEGFQDTVTSTQDTSNLSEEQSMKLPSVAECGHENSSAASQISDTLASPLHEGTFSEVKNRESRNGQDEPTVSENSSDIEVEEEEQAQGVLETTVEAMEIQSKPTNASTEKDTNSDLRPGKDIRGETIPLHNQQEITQGKDLEGKRQLLQLPLPDEVPTAPEIKKLDRKAVEGVKKVKSFDIETDDIDNDSSDEDFDGTTEPDVMVVATMEPPSREKPRKSPRTIKNPELPPMRMESSIATRTSTKPSSPVKVREITMPAAKRSGAKKSLTTHTTIQELSPSPAMEVPEMPKEALRKRGQKRRQAEKDSSADFASVEIADKRNEPSKRGRLQEKLNTNSSDPPSSVRMETDNNKRPDENPEQATTVVRITDPTEDKTKAAQPPQETDSRKQGVGKINGGNAEEHQPAPDPVSSRGEEPQSERDSTLPNSSPQPDRTVMSLGGVQSPRRASSRLAKRDKNDELESRRQFSTSFYVSNGSDQSDRNGAGCIAQRDLAVGESFVDHFATYVAGTPKEEVLESDNSPRGSYIKTKEGYFRLVPSITEWINEPRDGQEANIDFRVKYKDFGEKPVLIWKVIKEIKSGQEVLANYGGHGGQRR